jgi:hypothetical protein
MRRGRHLDHGRSVGRVERADDIGGGGEATVGGGCQSVTDTRQSPQRDRLAVGDGSCLRGLFDLRCWSVLDCCKLLRLLFHFLGIYRNPLTAALRASSAKVPKWSSDTPISGLSRNLRRPLLFARSSGSL